MKLLVQWTQDKAPNWEEIDVADWPQTAGEPCCLSCQGVRFAGYDCYHAEPYEVNGENGIKITVWTPDTKIAAVWTFLPLAPDPLFGGALNTRQTRTVFTEKNWEDFIPPKEHIRLGKMLTEELFLEHLAKAKPRGWREIAPGVKVPPQRDQGKFPRPKHTRTWYQTGAAATGHSAVAAQNKRLLDTTPHDPETHSATVVQGGLIHLSSFITPAGQPNSADWPSGEYRCQLDVVTADADLIYGLMDLLGPVDGGFVVNDSGAAAERFVQDQSSFSGTGLKLATASYDPAAGNATDRLEVVINVNNTSGKVSGDIAIDVGTSDSFVDAPFANLLTSGGGSAHTQPGLIHQVSVVEY